jgi:gluconate 2-dehydrogenase gamma chain
MKTYSHQNRKYPNKPKLSQFESHWTSGINRRDFVKSSLAISLLAGLVSCKPSVDDKSTEPLIKQSDKTVKLSGQVFTDSQQLDLQAISMRLFPDDGDGPSADDLNFLTYLEWAMTDEQNVSDGDPEFIAKGIGWLNQFANDDYSKDFKDLGIETQDKLLTTTAKSDAGENWMALLVYYLIEALALDPYYGGNPDQVGWKWLQHQGGFPHPIAGKTYRDFE